MFTYETADQKEVRRFRIAQFNGRMATVKAGESTVTGFVRSVLEQDSTIPPRWTITIIPNAPKEEPKVLRPNFARAPLRRRLFVEPFSFRCARCGFNRSNAAARRGRGPRCCARRACASLRPDGSRRCAG